MKEKIYALISEYANIDIDKINDDMELNKDLEINSVDFADIAFKCEEELNVEFDDKDLKKIITVKDLVDYVGGLTE